MDSKNPEGYWEISTHIFLCNVYTDYIQQNSVFQTL